MCMLDISYLSFYSAACMYVHMYVGGSVSLRSHMISLSLSFSHFRTFALSPHLQVPLTQGSEDNGGIPHSHRPRKSSHVITEDGDCTFRPVTNKIKPSMQAAQVYTFISLSLPFSYAYTTHTHPQLNTTTTPQPTTPTTPTQHRHQHQHQYPIP